MFCLFPGVPRCHSPSLASVKSRLALPSWYRLTRVVLDKGPLKECACHLICLSVQYREPGSLPWHPVPSAASHQPTAHSSHEMGVSSRHDFAHDAWHATSDTCDDVTKYNSKMHVTVTLTFCSSGSQFTKYLTMYHKIIVWSTYIDRDLQRVKISLGSIIS